MKNVEKPTNLAEEVRMRQEWHNSINQFVRSSHQSHMMAAERIKEHGEAINSHSTAIDFTIALVLWSMKLAWWKIVLCLFLIRLTSWALSRAINCVALWMLDKTEPQPPKQST